MNFNLFTEYNRFGKIEKISGSACGNTSSMDFIYGPSHLRRQVTWQTPSLNLQRNYTINYEVTNITGSQTENQIKEYIFSPFGLVAIRNNGVLNAVATDHLGSIVAEFNPKVNDFEFFGYDPWGRRYRYDATTNERFYFDENPPILNCPSSILNYFTRGFTGHEHLDMFGIINMNGRLYDQLLGRFLSPDPFVQDPTFTQNFNRYSYAFNNPLRFTDPTGYWNEPPESWMCHWWWIGLEPSIRREWDEWLWSNPGGTWERFAFLQQSRLWVLQSWYEHQGYWVSFQRCNL
jgi:RHS repeat-associated protein